MRPHFAILSGICAASAGGFGKLTGLGILEGFLVLRLLSFCAMVICNAGVWTLFVKALHQSDSSLVATVVSSASNYMFSALFGFLLFGEVTSLLWWTGMFFIIIGVLFILVDQKIGHAKI